MLTTILLLAQLHVATPVEKLHGEVKFSRELPPVPADFKPQGAKAINITARQFVFDVTSDAEINQGDSVTINVTAADVTHGFFLEQYMNQGLTIDPGETVTVNFIAALPGTFTYFCSFFCGEGHGNMFGRLTVNAVTAEPPAIASFTPSSAPITGGTPVLITGSGFASGAVIRFGDSNALTTIVSTETSILAITPARAAGAVPITVFNPDGQTATAAALFTFTNPQQAPRPARRRAVRR
ncbi:MAG TPA: IPT/TIG domain-containing protein [Thermoanaerobaculia bacterium]